MCDSMDTPNLPSGAALAFLGDAVFSLHVRSALVSMGISHSKRLNVLTQNYVTSTAQAQFFSEIQELLTEEERGIYRRAANSTHLQKPKNTTAAVYRSATGLEALLGALYCSGQHDRLNFLLSKLNIEVDNNDKED